MGYSLKNRLSKQRGGFILVTVMGLMTILTLAVISIFTRGLWQTSTGTRLYDRSGALYLAEAAIEQASLNLKTPTTTDDITAQTISTGSFSISPPQLIGVNTWLVIATGTQGDNSRQVETIFRLTPQSIFQFAIFGDLNMSVSGSAETDSFDSSLGPYNDDSSDPAYNAGHNGDVGTNATTSGGVDVGGSIFIDGQIAVGYGAPDPYAVVDGYDPLFVTGGTDPPSDTQDVVTQSNAFPLSSVTVPAGLTCIDHTVTGSTIETLTPTGGDNGDGVYCYNDLTLQGGSTLTTSGDVTVYITGQFRATGNSLMGNVSDPTQLLVKMTSSGDVAIDPGVMSGTTGFYGALYAPESTIDISGNAEIFGSIIAAQINVTGHASIHYDESITGLDEVSNTFTTKRLTWQEI